jgi:hypothetical protein
MNKTDANEILESIRDFVTTKYADQGVTFNYSGSYGYNSVKITLDLGLNDPDTGESADETHFKAFAARYNLKPEWYGQIFKHQGASFKITGISTRRPRFPVTGIRVKDGAGMKFPADFVISGMTRGTK